MSIAELTLEEATMISDEIGQSSLGVGLEGSEFIGEISMECPNEVRVLSGEVSDASALGQR